MTYWKFMKLSINLSLFILTLFMFDNKSLSITDYEIKEICKKEKKRLTCMKKLQKKRMNYKKGEIIEIPVIPYKR